ncbi:MAG: hypothetical protein WDA07_14220 [Leucobacter sp.]
MARRIPGKLLPHRDLVKVDTYKGGGAGGRVYTGQTTVKRALIIDDVQLIRDQYDAETVLSAIVYLERGEIAAIPEPETKVTIWAGTTDERTAYVVKCGRYQHPKIADLLEVRLR